MSNAPFPPPPAWVTCPKCTAQVPCYDPAGSRYFCCFHCRTYFAARPAPGSAARFVSGFKRELPPGPSLPLGATGTLGGYRCRLTGYQVRGEQQDRVAEWREYQLRPAEPRSSDDPFDFPLQLAEYQGHWLLIRRAKSFPNPRATKPYTGKEWQDPATDHAYQLWHRYQPVIRDAQGEFDWDILEDEKLTITEYTGPPYLLASEHQPGVKTTWYLAEHLEPAQVATAFGLNVAALPSRQGVGAAQPAPVPGWPQLRSLALATLVLLGLAQALVLGLRPEGQLFEQDFLVDAPTQAGGTSQMLTSRSFELATAGALSVELTAPDLTNHWVEVTASLVNEQTGRGYEFTRSLEYYQGVEDGESWSEGNHSADAVLASVPPGRYHFNLYPTLEQGLSSTSLRMHAYGNTPLWSNFFVVLSLLALVPAAAWWRRRAFEQERWSNSDFNPYSSE